MSDQDMDAALDALEVEHGVDLDQEIEATPELDVVDDPIEDIQDVESDEVPPVDDKPPGYMGYEEWIAAGKDPDLFKGSKAYSAEYDRIQEVKELKGLVSKVVDSTSEWKAQQQLDTARQIEQARIDTKAELEQAKANHDIDGALAASDKLNELNSQPEPQPEQPGMNPVITDFFNKNPILDRHSSQFDADVFQDASTKQRALLDDLTNGNRALQSTLTDSQIQRTMNIALKTAKDLNPDKFRSPRNGRQQAPSQARRAPSKEVNHGSKLKSVKFESKHNKRDTNAANDIYETLKAIDPSAAETFAKKLLKD